MAEMMSCKNGVAHWRSSSTAISEKTLLLKDKALEIWRISNSIKLLVSPSYTIEVAQLNCINHYSAPAIIFFA